MAEKRQPDTGPAEDHSRRGPWELPEGWEWTTLADTAAPEPNSIVDGPFGSDLLATEYTEEGIPIIRLQNIGWGQFLWKEQRYISMKKFNDLRRHAIFPGDLVVAKLGDPGKTCMVPSEINPGVIVADCIRIKPHSDVISPKYLMHLMNSSLFRRYLETQGLIHGVTRPRINMGDLKALSIPLAPLPLQRRIVAQIESLHARSRAAREALDRVPGLMKRFRQAVLAKAFRGELTEREDGDESAEVLLERIWEERREKWEEGLKAKGKDPRRYRYEEPEPVDAEGLPELPDEWVWVTLEHIIMPKQPTYGIVKPGSEMPPNVGVPYVCPDNISEEGTIDAESLRRTSRTISENYSRTVIRNGDVIITIRATIGRVAVVDTEVHGANLSRGIAKLTPMEGILPSYLMWTLRNEIIQRWIQEKARGIALRQINLSDLKLLPIPLIPTAEQSRIVSRIESLFSHAQSIESAAREAQGRMERLDQAVLGRAFRGELVAT